MNKTKEKRGRIKKLKIKKNKFENKKDNFKSKKALKIFKIKKKKSKNKKTPKIKINKIKKEFLKKKTFKKKVLKSHKNILNAGHRKLNIKKISRKKEVRENKKHIKLDSAEKSGFAEKAIGKASPPEVKQFSEKIKEINLELEKIIIGQKEIVNGLIRALICNGHVLVEGVPGTAKTLIVKALAAISGCKTERIQFTVDLLPTDILGLTIYKENKGFEIVKGPIFTNFLIADEINRAPPKTQSALLEAMQERQITIGKERFPLPEPFLVMATQNPVEQAGVYILPEAQVDRFVFKLLINYPEKAQEREIMKRNVDLKKFEDFNLRKIISPAEIIKMQALAKKIHIGEAIENYITEIVNATRNKKGKYSKYIEWGASPRATIALFLASKAEALMKGRIFVVPEDVKSVALDVLRHRLILTYEAEAENITSDFIIKKILDEIPIL